MYFIQKVLTSASAIPC